MSKRAQIESYLGRIAQSDPHIYNALKLMTEDLSDVYEEVFNAEDSVSTAQTGAATLGAVTNFTAQAFPLTLRLMWDSIATAFTYEIRVGASFDLGQHVITVNANQVNLDPVALDLTYGTYTFWIKPLDSSGVYGDTATSVDITISQITAPLLSATVISNTILLSWTVPISQFAIDYYAIYRDGVQIGRINGTFKAHVEAISDTYEYSVKAFDIVGNEGTESNIVSAVLNSPVEFEAVAEVDADYGGTVSHVKIITYGDVEGILGAYEDETYEDHFINNSYATPQDQIDDGYPLYFQPSAAVPGTYEEVFDFGAALDAVTVIVSYDKIQLAGNTLVEVTIEDSLDGIAWGTPVNNDSQYYASVRYVRITLTFTNDDQTAAAFVSALKVSANVQFAIDSGAIAAISTDAGGTTVTFNRVFKAAPKVKISGVDTTAIIAVADSITTTDFKALAFNTAGTRVSKTLNWIARGI